MGLFKPNDYYVSVLDIDPCELVAQGYKGLILDLDNTILPRTTYTVPSNLKAWVQSVKDSGLKACFLSNNWHERVVNNAKDLDIELVGKAVKPLIHGFFIARKRLGLKRKETLVIGDQTYTDILGAHLAGLKAYLVMPLSTQDLWHTKLLRKMDRFFLRNLTPKGSAPAFIDEENNKALL